jgi:hypothetical protein
MAANPTERLEVVVIPPRWRTTRELYQQAIEVSRELVAALDPDDLLRLSCSALAQALERRIERGI